MASPTPAARASRSLGAWIGLAVALILIVAAMLIPKVFGWDVHVRYFPPLHAEWNPRLGFGTLPAIALGAVGSVYALRMAERLSWPRLLLTTYVVGLGWLMSLALVDGSDGLGTILEDSYEYLDTARTITDIPAMLNEYVSRIPYSAEPNNWPVHLAGHPPGAVLFFIGLVRVGLGGGLAAGIVVTCLAATTALAVMSTLRTLGAERAARRAAPFLVFSPAAIWMSVSADAVFAAVAAWGMAALALASVRSRDQRSSLLWSGLAGLLLGYTVMMSYGLPLLGLLAVAILIVGGSWRPLIPAALVALAVVLAFAAYGFYWWEALPVLRERYWDGVASNRPPEYWMWGNLAALAFSAGPVAYAGLGNLVHRPSIDPVSMVEPFDGAQEPPVETTHETQVVTWLAGAGVAMIVAADLSR